MILEAVLVFLSMTVHFGFTMGALNENGSVFANPCKGEKNMGRLRTYTRHVFYGRKICYNL